VSGTTLPGQSQMWLSLLVGLTDACPGWMVMKGVESALVATGDVDSIAPSQEWVVVRDRFRSWATDSGLGPVVACTHAPYLLHLIALTDARPEFFELDVNRRKIFLGSTLFRPEDVAPMAIIDDRGFRRLPPGVEGVLKLVQNGMHRDGSPDIKGLRDKGIRDLLAEDPEGVVKAAGLFGRGRGALIRACEAVVDGGWDRRALLEMQSWCVLRGVGEPDAAMARLRFRRRKKSCPVLISVFEHGRTIPGDRESWLESVASTHQVFR
jgi:hypothetical protein